VTAAVRVVRTCRVCGAEDWSELLSLGAMPPANDFRAAGAAEAARFPLDVIVCRACRLMSLRHVVAPEALYRHYSYLSPESSMLARHMRWLVRESLARFEVPPGSLILEIGSNVGHLLEIARAEGMRVLGVDPARNIAELANARGVETVPEFFSEQLARDLSRRRGPARVVVARHVLAHVDDLDDLVAAVRASLATDGVLVVEVPYLRDLLEGCQFDTIYHEHLSYFAVGTLVRLFELRGMRVLGVDRAEVHGGALVVYAGVRSCRWPTDPAVGRMVAEERDAGLAGLAAFAAFAAGVGAARRRIGGLVRRLAGEGHRVAAYGAAAKGATLLNACQLGRAEIEYCQDTTALKQGLLMPGSGVPIVSPAVAAARPPMYYLLLAWNYAEEIVQREQNFLANGGRFVIPGPAPRIVSGAGRYAISPVPR
jgi:SAM-dependent methyltransferase